MEETWRRPSSSFINRRLADEPWPYCALEWWNYSTAATTAAELPRDVDDATFLEGGVNKGSPPSSAIFKSVLDPRHGVVTPKAELPPKQGLVQSRNT
jgi:hypothetical protein